MNFRYRKLVHWLAAIAIAMSALAPALSQAVSLVEGGNGFAMEICSVDGSKCRSVFRVTNRLTRSIQPNLVLTALPISVSHQHLIPI